MMSASIFLLSLFSSCCLVISVLTSALGRNRNLADWMFPLTHANFTPGNKVFIFKSFFRTMKTNKLLSFRTGTPSTLLHWRKITSNMLKTHLTCREAVYNHVPFPLTLDCPVWMFDVFMTATSFCYCVIKEATIQTPPPCPHKGNSVLFVFIL